MQTVKRTENKTRYEPKYFRLKTSFGLNFTKKRFERTFASFFPNYFMYSGVGWGLNFNYNCKIRAINRCIYSKNRSILCKYSQYIIENVRRGLTVLLTAYLLLITESGKETEIAVLLKTIAGVEEVYLVYGTYDVVVKIKVENMDALQEIVSSHLMNLKEIKSTVTLVLIPEKPKVVVLEEETPKLVA